MPPADAALKKNPDCPFCAIATAFPPSAPQIPTPIAPASVFTSTSTDAQSQRPAQAAPTTPIAHTILSTRNVLVFLDHAPIARGHTLVVVRAHREKLSDVTVREGAMLGRWLGCVSRAVVGALASEEEGMDSGKSGTEQLGDETAAEEAVSGDWNVVQNNGIRAAQVVPHVHFHIIPRTADVPEVKARSWTVFGRGQREDLNDEDAAILAARMRERLGVEVDRIRRREGDSVVRSMLEDESEGGDWERRWSRL